MQIEEDSRRGGNCPFSCDLSSLLTMNCKAKAQGFAHRLQSQGRYKGTATEERLLVESDGKVRLAMSDNCTRTYSMDDHHLESFSKISDMKNLRPIHVVTSEPTLHLCLPPQPEHLDEASPTEQEQDSDVYYDFDLVTPPEDYASPVDSRAVEREIIPEENDKPEKPESGCVTSVTSPIMFSENLDDHPPSSVESPSEEGLHVEDPSGKVSDVNLETVRQLLVSSKHTEEEQNKPIEIKDNDLPDFVGVVKNPNFIASSSCSENSTSSSERGSSSEAEIHISEEEKAKIYEKKISPHNFNYYLPPPSSYQIFSNTECELEQGEMPNQHSKAKPPRRKQKRKRSVPYISNRNESSESRESPLQTNKPRIQKDLDIDTQSNLENTFNSDTNQVCRSSSLDDMKQKSKKKPLKSSNSIETCTYIVLSHNDNDASLRRHFEFDLAGQVSSKVYKQYCQNNQMIKDSSDTEILLSPREDLPLKVINIPNKGGKSLKETNEKKGKGNDDGRIKSNKEEHLTSSFDEREIIIEMNETISVLKSDENDSIGEKLSKYESNETRIFGTHANKMGEGLEQVADAPFDKHFHFREECQNLESASQLSEVCEKVPFLIFKDNVRDKKSDVPLNNLKCDNFYKINSASKNNCSGDSATETEMPRSKGRSKVKRATPTDTQAPSNVGVAEFSENGATPAITKTSAITRNNFSSDGSIPLNIRVCENKLENSNLNHSGDIGLKENGSNDPCHLNDESTVLKMLGLTRNGPQTLETAKNVTENVKKYLDGSKDNFESDSCNIKSELNEKSYNYDINDNSVNCKNKTLINSDCKCNTTTNTEFVENKTVCDPHKESLHNSTNGEPEDISFKSDDNVNDKSVKNTVNDEVDQIYLCGDSSCNERNEESLKEESSSLNEFHESTEPIKMSAYEGENAKACVAPEVEGRTDNFSDVSLTKEEEIMRYDSDNEKELDETPVDEIEVLPEKEEEDNVREGVDADEEESDEEIVLSGRFKNIAGYTEKVSRLSDTDDELPPPPTEVILIDYDEPLEAAPEEEEEAKQESDIGEDLASELNRLTLDEPTVKPPSDESERSSEERENEGADKQQRIKRSSSLRCGKTPPGTPGRKKIVRFADCLGLDLADIRTFLDGVPNVPPSAFCDLQVEEDSGASGSQTSHPPSYSSYSAAASAAAAVLQNQAHRILTPMFQQPGALPDFYDRLREQKVVLENVSVGSDLSVKGIVRVVNESFHKKVFVRYTFDQWRNYHEATASYVDGSCDGFSDRFSFLLWGSFLQSNGSLVFCVKYCVNGSQYWDNNWGSNYVLKCYSTGPVRPLHGRPQNECSIQQNQQDTNDNNRRDSSSSSVSRGGGGGGGPSNKSHGSHGYSSFTDYPTTPTDPWVTQFF